MSASLLPLLNSEPTPLRPLIDQSPAAKDPLNPTTTPTTTGTTNPTSPTTTTSTTLPDFRELLALMMMGMTMQGGGDESGFSVGSMMAPLMMSLMEQLLAQEVTTDNTTSTTSNTQVAQDTPQGLPVEGRFTQYFHPGHNGVDIAIVTGTPIQTTMDGNVIYAGWNNQGYGNLVIVENGPYRTYYAHLSEIPVEVGQTVHAGEVIGLSGSTGNSTGPHLHYEVRYNGQPVDPQGYF
ncbi:MAG: M23 family metallopeptidase [Anaerolineales bacterium]|nr:M23 family metallopeptidase [Anaerolineales bacterium]